MNGPGRYDLECGLIMNSTQAEAVLLAVVNGNDGSGFSVQAPAHVIKQLPGVLRQIADQIESQKDVGAN